MRVRASSEGYHRLGVLFGSPATVTAALFSLAALGLHADTGLHRLARLRVSVYLALSNGRTAPCG